MSSDSLPVTSARFAAALKDLLLSTLHLKVLELRNSIAHLDYSNEQLRPFADGVLPVHFSTTTSAPQPDPDCIDAIRENEQVIARMRERIALVRAEVETRGVSWRQFQSKVEVDGEVERLTTNGYHENGADVEEESKSQEHPAWRDGTFMTGVIGPNGDVRVNGIAESGASRQGTTNMGAAGSLAGEELRRRVEEQMRRLGDGEDGDGDADGGLHL